MFLDKYVKFKDSGYIVNIVCNKYVIYRGKDSDGSPVEVRDVLFAANVEISWERLL